jgi:hypothetical protein
MNQVSPNTENSGAFMPRDNQNLSLDETVRLLMDEKEIRDIQHRWCRAISRVDVELMKSCFHPGALDHHAPFFDRTVEEMAETFTEGTIASAQSMQYVVHNMLVEVDGDVARSEVVVWSMKVLHERTEAGEQIARLSGLRYLDRLERRKGRWGIVERWFIPEWGFFHPLPPHTKAIGPFVPPSEWKTQPLRGAQDRTDKSYNI